MDNPIFKAEIDTWHQIGWKSFMDILRNFQNFQKHVYGEV